MFDIFDLCFVFYCIMLLEWVINDLCYFENDFCYVVVCVYEFVEMEVEVIWLCELFLVLCYGFVFEVFEEVEWM